MNKLVVAIASVGSLLQVVAAHAGCIDVTAVPITISQPGRYCLTQDLVFEGTAPIGTLQRAIHVAANDVVVDFNGYTILGTGTSPASSTSYAVWALSRSNVTITNGRIRGFGMPISLYYSRGTRSTGYAVEHMVIEGALAYGIYVLGDNSMIRNNRVSDVAPGNTVGTPHGIYVSGDNMRILDNHITNITSTVSSAAGIGSSGFGAVIQRNFISDVSSPTNLIWGISLRVGANSNLIKDNVLHNATTIGDGISASQATNAMIDNNVITGFFYAINLGTRPGVGKYRNNSSVGTGSAAPYFGGTDIGGNN
jgi:hypothetical protein